MPRRNVGGIDRWARLVLGPALLAAGLLLLGGAEGRPLGVIAALAGLGSLLSAVTGRCPLYVPFGVSTARAEGPAAERPGSPSR